MHGEPSPGTRSLLHRGRQPASQGESAAACAGPLLMLNFASSELSWRKESPEEDKDVEEGLVSAARLRGSRKAQSESLGPRISRFAC